MGQSAAGGINHLQSSRACERGRHPYLFHCTTTGTSTIIRIFYHRHLYVSFFFQLSHFPVKDKEADARSCIQSINTLPCRRKVQIAAAAELYTVRAAIFIVERLTVSCVAECYHRSIVVPSVCDHCSQSSECRIVDRWIFKVHKQ